ncbi:hypothetical protein MKX03_009239 [Papaver bracteatum]|nr:hypothetical protein MKX03_009239 [Papaver bracteatum]
MMNRLSIESLSSVSSVKEPPEDNVDHGKVSIVISSNSSSAIAPTTENSQINVSRSFSSSLVNQVIKEEEQEGEEQEGGVNKRKMMKKRETSPDILLNDDGYDPNIKKAGGWKTMPYIIGNETFEKLASMSLTANMTVYLRTQYNMDGLTSVSIASIWGGTCNITTLLGAFVSDAYLGRYWTLLTASIIYFLGMGMMTLTAAIPYLRPPSCNKLTAICQEPEKWQLGVLFFSLVLLSLGAGGIRPVNIAFGVDQFDVTTEKGKKQVESFYNWYYWGFTIALIVALTIVVYIQNNISWAWGLAIPTAVILLSIVVFLIGSKLYICVKPRGSVFIDVAKVISAAIRKRKIKLKPTSEHTLFDNPSRDPTAGNLCLTNRFSCLTKAAVITEEDSFNDQGLPTNGWRLCSIQQVEQFKCIISVMPVWVSGIACFVCMDQQSTQGVLQAIQSDTRFIHNFHVPPGSMGIAGMITLSIWIPIYEHLVLPLSRRMSKDGVGITLKHRLGAGIVMSIICMVVAGIVEGRRRESALKNHTFIAPMSFAWLIPQYALSGMTEVFTGVGIMEFLAKQFPPSMRTLAGSLFFLSLACASYVSSFLINLIHRISQSASGDKDGSNPGWLGGTDLNKNKLDYYYFIVAGICVLNLLFYIFFASRYVDTSKKDEEGERDVELNS